MMSHGDRLAAQILPKILKPLITQLPGSHLNRQTILSGILFRVKIHSIKRYLPSLRQTSHERLIPLRLITSQMEIAMRHNTSITQPTQKSQKGNRVGTSTYPNQNRGLASQKGMTLNISLNLPYHPVSSVPTTKST